METNKEHIQPKPPAQWKRTVAAIWAGQAFSILTAYASSFAGIWYVTETTDSAFMLAMASLCAMLPQGVLGPFGGVAADRFSRKRIMMAADAFVGSMALLMGILVATGHLSVALVLVMSALRSVGMAFHVPAMESAMPLLVPKRHLVRINTLNQSLLSLSWIVGPVFGIFFYELIGLQAVLLINAAGCALAVLTVSRASIPQVRDESEEAGHPLKSLKVGLDVLVSDKGLFVSLVIMVGVMAMYAGINTLFPLMTYDHFNGTGYQASLLEAVYGVTTIVGAGVLFVWGGGRHLLRVVAAAGVAAGVLLLAQGFLGRDMFFWFVVLTGASGLAESFFSGPLLAVVQRRVPAEKLGRVIGLFTTMSALASPLGLALAGTCAEFTGVANWFIIAGVIVSVLGLMLGLLPITRRLDAEVAASFESKEDAKRAIRAAGVEEEADE